MSWLRLDADMPWNDKVVGLPNDTARFAYVKALCAAKVRGQSTFSVETLREILGSHAKAIPALVAAQLLDEDEHGLSVRNFERYQRLALQQDRQRRYRERHDGVTPASQERHANVTTGQDVTGRDGTTPYSPPTSFIRYRSKEEKAPGEAFIPVHDGRHGKTCLPCFPVIEEKA